MGNTCVNMSRRNLIFPGITDPATYRFWSSAGVAGGSEEPSSSSSGSNNNNSTQNHTDKSIPNPNQASPIADPNMKPNGNSNSNSNPNPNANANHNPNHTTTATAPAPQAMKKGTPQALTESVLGRKTELLRDLYTLGQKLGQGQFGTTYLCTEKVTGKAYACKSIAKRKLLAQDDVDDVRREIQIMHHLAGCPSVVSIRGAYEDPSYVHLVMELCEGGELFDRIIKRGHYTEKKAAQLMRTIVGVIQTCHSLGVMHRDLKPENFLFANKNEDADLKTIDFGLSIFFKPGEVFRDVVGSPYYVAPEVLRKRYGPKADVWSCGVILYILLSGVPPFWDETEQGIFEQVLHGELDFDSNPWPHISDIAKDLIRSMLNRNTEKRLTAHQVLCHPWIREDGVAPDKPIDVAVLSRMKQFMAMNKMKKIALRVIAERLSEEEIAGLKEIFKMMDTDNSGTITFDELKDGLKKLGSGLMDAEIHTIMEAADVDNSGSIDYGEFVAATLHLNKMEREDNLFAAFQYFDKDSSGYITVDELQEACVEHNMGDTHIEELIREIDQDNDGRIDYNEFVAMMTKGNIAGRRTMRNDFLPILPEKVVAG